MWLKLLAVTVLSQLLSFGHSQQLEVQVPACSAQLDISAVDTHKCAQEGDALQTYTQCSGATYNRCCQHLMWSLEHKCHCLPDFDQRQRKHVDGLARDCAGWKENFGGKDKAILSEIKLFVGVLTSAAKWRSRQAIRKTWGSDPLLHRVLFFVAKPGTEEGLEQLRKEAGENADIVILPTVTESYFNITFQTLEVLRFGAADPTTTHVLKADDDTYVRVGNLLARIAEAPKERTFLGFIENPGGGPHRNQQSQWYVKPEEWPSERYPPWAHGAGYVLSQDLVRQIAGGGALLANSTALFKLEDIAVASWVENTAKDQNWAINYVHDSRFNYRGCSPGDLISHYVKPKNMICMYSRNGDCCLTSSISKHQTQGIVP